MKNKINIICCIFIFINVIGFSSEDHKNLFFIISLEMRDSILTISFNNREIGKVTKTDPDEREKELDKIAIELLRRLDSIIDAAPMGKKTDIYLEPEDFVPYIMLKVLKRKLVGAGYTNISFDHPLHGKWIVE